MKMMNHPNVVGLKHCFYSTTEKDEASCLLTFIERSAISYLKSCTGIREGQGNSIKRQSSCLH